MTSINSHKGHVNEHGVAFGGPANVAATFGFAIIARNGRALGVPGLEVPGRHHPLTRHPMTKMVLEQGQNAIHRYAAILVRIGIAHVCRTLIPRHVSTLPSSLRAPNKTKSVILSAAQNLLAEARSRTGKKILRCAQNDR